MTNPLKFVRQDFDTSVPMSEIRPGECFVMDGVAGVYFRTDNGSVNLATGCHVPDSLRLSCAGSDIRVHRVDATLTWRKAT